MRIRLLVIVSAIALATAACTSTQGTVPGERTAPLPTETLLLGTQGGPLVVSVPSGSVLFQRSGAVASFGGGWVLAAEPSAGSTELTERAVGTGEVAATTRVPGTLTVRTVSESGRSVALTEPLPNGWDPDVPLPRSRTTIVVADPTGATDPRTFDLRGNFEPEAFSSDDSRLFLIQHLPAETPTVYRVTVLDLRRGEVLPVFGPFKGPAERMPGTRLEQVLAPGGSQLYTLYSSSLPGYAPHHSLVPASSVVSFIHVLSLDEGWAHCVGLPEAFWERPAAEQAMAASPDGDRLYIVDAALGLVSVMDTHSLEILRTGTVELGATGVRRTSAIVSSDGGTLFVGTGGASPGVAAIDLRTFEVAERWATGSVSGLGMSQDGRRLYLALGDRVRVLDASTGSALGDVAVASPGPIDSVNALVT